MSISVVYNEGLDFKENEKVIYEIHKDDLCQTRNEISNWIFHVLEKKWVTRELLYDVAYLIHQHCAGHHIDWQKTFYTVEMQDYTDRAFEIKQSLEGNGSTDSDVRKYFDFSFSARSNEELQAIHKIVQNQLKEKNIIR